MKNKMLPVVIIAGGLATRLRPISEKIPKSLIEINGEPFISHQLRLLKKNGINQIIMCVGYLGESIVEFVEDGKRFDLSVKYSFDGPALLGTAGAIRKALPLLPENFFVLNGDSYLPCNYETVQNVFFEFKKQALMTVFHNKGCWDASNVEFAANTILNYDKQHRNENMQFIDYGLEVFSRSVFETLEENTFYDLTCIYKKLIAANQLSAYEISQRFYENGSFAGIEDLREYLAV